MQQGGFWPPADGLLSLVRSRQVRCQRLAPTWGSEGNKGTLLGIPQGQCRPSCLLDVKEHQQGAKGGVTKSMCSEPDAVPHASCETQASPASLSVKGKSQQHLPHTFVMRMKQVSICQMLRVVLARGKGLINVCETLTWCHDSVKEEETPCPQGARCLMAI